MTLSELAFIMFFLLVILSAAAITTSKDETDKKKDEVVVLEDEVAVLTRQRKDLTEIIDRLNKELSEQFKRLSLLEKKDIQFQALIRTASVEDIKRAVSKLVEANKNEDAIAELKEVIAKLKKSETELQEKFTKLEKNQERQTQIMAVLAKNGLLDDTLNAIDELVAKGRQLAEIEEILGTQGYKGITTTGVADLVEKLNDANRQKDNIKGQYANIKNRLDAKGNGLDHPPCWADQNGKIEYLYTITMYENSFQVAPAWPNHRKDELSNITGAEALISDRINLSNFRRQAGSVLNWSKQQSPACRHFVRLRDSENTSKNAAFRNMQIAEQFFYKYLEKN